jgi:hypothetical protein
MEKEFLESCLAAGMSLDEIGVLVDKHPSTVSHHLKKFGLEAVGHDRHAPKGGVDVDRLRELIEGGASLYAASAELGVSYTTIRYWVKKLGLETQRMVRLRKSREVKEDGQGGAWLDCPVHGKVWFFVRPDSGFRCSKCRSEDVSNWRRRVKLRLVERAGGCCELCAYDRCIWALQFHHVDPDAKKFSLSRHGVTRSYAEAAAEADKCVLLCANCHAEIEADEAELPIELLTVKLLAVELVPN